VHQIYNGANVSVAKLCGSNLPNPIFLNTSSARLQFRTDGSVTRRGYDITYTASPSGTSPLSSVHIADFIPPHLISLHLTSSDLINVQISFRHSVYFHSRLPFFTRFLYICNHLYFIHHHHHHHLFAETEQYKCRQCVTLN